MTKKRKEKPKREVTRRQLSRWQRQKRRQRIALGLGVFIIVAALGIVGAGWYVSYYQPLRQTVIRVNDTEFDMNYYVKILKSYGEDQPASVWFALADIVTAEIQKNELIRQGAMKPPMSISISDDAVDEELKSRDPPLSKDYRDIVRVEMIANKLRDEYFEQKVSQFAKQRHIMAIFLESESQAVEVRARLEKGEEFAELAVELSLEGFSRFQKGNLDWHPKDTLAMLLGSSIPGEYAFNAEAGVLSQPIYDEAKAKSIGYWLVKVLERKKDSDEADIRAILLGSEEQAQDVKARIEAGERFNILARELSEHEESKEDGGDLGWLAPGTVSQAFDKFAFNSEVELGTVSEPLRDEAVATAGGYWLLKVVGIDDNRQITEDDRDLLKNKALDEWLSALWDNPENKVENYLDDKMQEWAVQQATGGLE